MFAGHIGVALAAARLEPRVNVGALTVASLLLDVLLWLFVLMGWESVSIPSTFSATHQPEFVFPYSHSVLAGVGWSALAGLLALALCRDRRSWSALVVGGVVFSHWLLDVLVHRPEMPVAGATSARLGLGLWNHMPLALLVEGLLVGVGVLLFLRGSGLPRWRQLTLAAVGAFILVFTVVGMTVAPPPPSATAMAGSSLAAIVAASLFIGWLGGRARAGQA